MTAPATNFDITAFSIAELIQFQELTAREKARVARDEALLQGELARRFGDQVKAALARMEKSAGTVTEVLPGAGGVRLQSKADKKVEWDNDKLLAFASGLPWETAAHYLRFKLEAKEAVYKALLPDSETRKTLTDARTEKVGKTKYELLAPEAE